MSDLTPRDVGAQLRAARERQGVTLRQLTLRTKIPLPALDALERNDLTKVPRGIFGRSFVRIYAEEVGLDPAKVLDAFVEAFPDHGCGVSAQPSWAVDAEWSDGPRRMTAAAVGLALLSIPVVVGIVFVLRGDQSSADDPSRSASAVSFTQARAGAEAPVAQPLLVEIHPTGDCHVSLTVDGRRVLSRVVRAGEREVHEVQDRVVIEAGDAASFAFSINRQRGQSLGAPGDDVTLVIDRDNYRRFLVQ